ncbi:hypothetical protein ABE85_18825 [Mitsuaria sp. 7]|nr:hypothetical protein ABE85_18825 [Mitsuaria sp. 7]
MAPRSAAVAEAGEDAVPEAGAAAAFAVDLEADAACAVGADAAVAAMTAGAATPAQNAASSQAATRRRQGIAGTGSAEEVARDRSKVIGGESAIVTGPEDAAGLPYERRGRSA